MDRGRGIQPKERLDDEAGAGVEDDGGLANGRQVPSGLRVRMDRLEHPVDNVVDRDMLDRRIVRQCPVCQLGEHPLVVALQEPFLIDTTS
jgi:hypothetical protein